ncbi:F-box protein SKIP19-like [Oryza brachyantha]|uniref:F-box domain-containing protein n=1 Tax=Oryza brachyantha TaxID=4533 RepID=J3MR33_ORYBR|nr:F-box protein SKIP19-like [Oryza brachyantha]
MDGQSPLPETRYWSEQPLDALSVIFSKLGAVEVLMGAGLVCHSWLHAAKVPVLWRTVEMLVCREMGSSFNRRGILNALGKVAVKRSNRQLDVLKCGGFATNELLTYVGHRSSSFLKSLYLDSCSKVTKRGFKQLIRKSPQLGDLVLKFCEKLRGNVYEAVAKACPRLRRLEVRRWISEDELLGIAAMHELRCLTLKGMVVRGGALAAIVDGCPHLELLDADGCVLLDVDDALRARCAVIDSLKLPSGFVAASDYDDYYFGREEDDDGGFEFNLVHNDYDYDEFGECNSYYYR